MKATRFSETPRLPGTSPILEGAPLLEARGVIKRFGPLLANDVAAFAVHPGEVVALLGENGAGKSTLCKILYGYYRADAGEIRVGGRVETIASPRDARRLGIGMVFQGFSLIPALTVWENVALFVDGLPRVTGPGEMRRRMGDKAESLGLRIDQRLPVGRLAVSDQQKVEILKQLVAGARVLILDEPTKVLAPQEVEGLFQTLRKLRDDGYGVVYITHKLREVMVCADRVAVMRQGRVVGTLPGPEATEAALLGLMFADQTRSSAPLVSLVPDAAPAMAAREPRRIAIAPAAARITLPPRSVISPGVDVAPDRIVLELEAITTAPAAGAVVLTDLSLNLRAGEILGIAGVSGNGQRELAEVVLGLRRPRRGIRRLWREDVTAWSARRTRVLGVASIPEDAMAQGAVFGLTVRENLVIGGGRRYRRGLGFDWPRLEADMNHSAARLGFPPLPYDTRASALSGGNLQRVVLTRELAHGPKLIVALYPTRGLDARSAASLRDLIGVARDAGAAVLLVSEDLDELFAISDRLIVLRGGRIAGTFAPASFHAETVGACMVGSEDAA